MIVTHIQQGTILSRLGFRGFVLEGHLILGLKIFRHGVVVTSNFSFPIASNWGFLSLNSTSFFSRVRSGEATSARFGMNFPKYVIMPKNRWSSFTEFGNGIFVIASIFAGSTFTPSDNIICLRNTMDFTLIWHFFYSVLVHFYESSKTLYLNAHYIRQEFYPRLLYHLGS